MVSTIVLTCKGCGAPLPISGGSEKFIQCEYCNVANMTAIADENAHVADINTQSAAAVHINLVMGKTDWNELAADPGMVTIEELDALIEKIKRVAGDKPETWEMCFYYVHACVSKKIDSISEMIPALVRDYVAKKNYNTCENTFDELKQSVGAIIARATKIESELREYCEQAEQRGAPADKIKKMKVDCGAITEKINLFSMPRSLADIPEVKAETERVRDEEIQKYSAKGIDLLTTYNRAVSLYNGGNFSEALAAFSSIHTYSDAANYIERINYALTVNANNKADGCFYVAGKRNFLEIGGKLRVLSEGLFTHNPINKNGAKIKDLGSPIVQSDIIRIYGDRAYYIDRCDFVGTKLDVEVQVKKGVQLLQPDNVKVYFYGAVSAPERPEDAEHDKNFVVANEILLTVESPSEDLKDAVKRKKDVFKQLEADQEPEFYLNIGGKKLVDLWQYDFTTGKAKILVQNISDFEERKDGVLYYIDAIIEPPAKKKMPAKVTYGLSCLKKNGNIEKDIISGKARIREYLPSGEILFTRDASTTGNFSKYNFNICVKKASGGAEERVLARNVYSYHGHHDGKILYAVGNDDVKALYSLNLAGGTEIELQKYMNGFSFVLESWLYLITGKKKERLFNIIRMPINGGDWEEVVHAAKELIPIVNDQEDSERDFIKNGRIFYKDQNDALCSVRLNGSGKIDLVRGFDSILCVTRDKIFYLATDDAGGGRSDVKSIYSMNFDGSMRKKLHFDIQHAKGYFAEKIYYTQTIEKQSIFDFYGEISFKKSRKFIDKFQKKLAKKDRDYYMQNLTSLFTLDCNTQETEAIATNMTYPTAAELNALKNVK